MSKAILYLLAALVLAADQATKWWVQHNFSADESRELIHGLFALTYVQNDGGAFGILRHGAVALAIAALAAIGGIVYYTVRAPRVLPAPLVFALGLPLGGAIGNLLDRVRHGYVVDFLDVYIGTHHWPVFNVADSSICIGVGLLALRFWLTAPPPETGHAGDEAAGEGT